LSGFVLGLAKKKLNNKAVLQKGNAESLPFKANSFDKLFCSEVIEHTLNPQLIIAEMHRILKVHGICVISIPNEKLSIRIKRILKLIGLYRFIMPANNSDKNNASDVCEWHLHVFSLDLLRKMVSGKFKIKDIKGVPFRIFPVKYVVRLDKIVE
jgi:ubiquinone/menaquinone biosynthesis C-methylase UbiE